MKLQWSWVSSLAMSLGFTDRKINFLLSHRDFIIAIDPWCWFSDVCISIQTLANRCREGGNLSEGCLYFTIIPVLCVEFWETVSWLPGGRELSIGYCCFGHEFSSRVSVCLLSRPQQKGKLVTSRGRHAVRYIALAPENRKQKLLYTVTAILIPIRYEWVLQFQDVRSFSFTEPIWLWNFFFYFFFLQYLKIGFINYPWTCTLNLFFLIIECQIELQCTKCI